MARTLLGIIGVGLALFCGSCAAVFGAVAAQNDPKASPVLAGVVALICLAFAAGGGWMAYVNFRPQRAGAPGSDFEREQAILQLAQAQGGRVTVAEVATHCRLGLADSKRVLDQIVVGGAAQLQLTDDGLLVYEFPGLGDEEEQPEPPRDDPHPQGGG